jgi:hypothetical protein
MTEQLSPAAQAVLDAYYCEKALVGSKRVAAALRVAADQVVPLCSTRSDRGVQRMMIRNDLLIIAAELEQSN